jgi:hypothetical protein
MRLLLKGDLVIAFLREALSSTSDFNGTALIRNKKLKSGEFYHPLWYVRRF